MSIFKTLFAESGMSSLHCPLTLENYHLPITKPLSNENGVMKLINTSRGALIDPQAAIDALKTRKLFFWVHGRV